MLFAQEFAHTNVENAIVQNLAPILVNFYLVFLAMKLSAADDMAARVDLNSRPMQQLVNLLRRQSVHQLCKPVLVRENAGWQLFLVHLVEDTRSPVLHRRIEVWISWLEAKLFNNFLLDLVLNSDEVLLAFELVEICVPTESADFVVGIFAERELRARREEQAFEMHNLDVFEVSIFFPLLHAAQRVKDRGSLGAVFKMLLISFGH